MTDSPRNKDEFKRAQQALERYCAYRDRAESEALRRLGDYELNEEEREAIINNLKQLNYLNDGRFAQSYVRGKFEIKRWGRIKIRAGLRSLSISPPYIQDALNQIDPNSYYETLTKLAEKKVGQMGGSVRDWNDQQKVVRYLLQRGFETDLIMDVVQGFKKAR